MEGPTFPGLVAEYRVGPDDHGGGWARERKVERLQDALGKRGGLRIVQPDTPYRIPALTSGCTPSSQ